MKTGAGVGRGGRETYPLGLGEAHHNTPFLFNFVFVLVLCKVFTLFDNKSEFVGGFVFILFYLFLAALGLRCRARAFSSCSERGLLLVAVRGLLIAVASIVAEHRL